VVLVLAATSFVVGEGEGFVFGVFLGSSSLLAIDRYLRNIRLERGGDNGADLVVYLLVLPIQGFVPSNRR